jgi:hypothetical protein
VEFRQRRPSPEALAWVERELGRGSRVVAWRRMTGGLTSAVHRLTVQRGPGRLAVVLRQYERSGIYDMAKIIEREAGILSGLPASGLAAPELLAACPAGEEAGGNPAILMTRLPGHLDLSPADPGVWHSLAGYNDAWPQFIPLQACGHLAVDVAGMTARVEEVLAAALRRL